MNVIKRDGTVVEFDKSKIFIAIQKANEKSGNNVSSFRIQSIADEIESLAQDRWNRKGETMSVEQIQDLVEKELVQYLSDYDIAKEYITYRYKRSLARKQNTTDEDILKLIANENKLMAEENANKDTTMASTQRDYIAGIVSRDLTRRLLLPDRISKAHDEGILHFHK